MYYTAIGCFAERDLGNYFEYSVNDDPINNVNEDCLHKIWFGDRYRYGTVKKSVAYVVVDEDEFGLPILEKWHLKKNKEYAK